MSILPLLMSRKKSAKIDLLIETDVFAYNVATEAALAGWDGVSKLNVTVEIGEGVVVGGAAGVPALYFPASIPGGSICKLINNGVIAGAGGDGGPGSNYELPAGAAGKNGGAALVTDIPLTVDNAGIIGGGGGGGGGGGDGHRKTRQSGSGGGGAGAPPGISPDDGLLAVALGYPATLLKGGQGTSSGGRTSNNHIADAQGGEAGKGGKAGIEKASPALGVTLYRNGGGGGGLGAGGAGGRDEYFSGEPTDGGDSPAGLGGAANSAGAYPLARIGGNAGAAVNGDSLITWLDYGTRYGPIIS